jgi:predicted kinase
MKEESIEVTMTTKVFHIVYGPPGSGKTSFAKSLNGKVFEFDDFEGLYDEKSGKINLHEIPNAHKWCQNAFKEGVEKWESPLIHTIIRLKSPNTSYYIDLALAHGYNVQMHTPLYGLLFHENDLKTREEQVELLIKRRGQGTPRYVPEEIIRDSCQSFLL